VSVLPVTGPATIVLLPVESWGVRMAKLLDDDAFAIDLLLDRTNVTAQQSDATHGKRAGAFLSQPIGDSVVKRIGAAEAILRLLAESPAPEPSPDLAHKTLQHIKQAGSTAHQMDAEHHQPPIGQGPQHA
jgi:hypothetical protein